MTHEEQRQRREDIAEYCKTHTRLEACAFFNLSYQTISQAAGSGGLRKERTFKTSWKSLPILARLINTGDALNAIAADCRVSKQYISQIYIAARDAGIAMPPRLQGTPNKPEEDKDHERSTTANQNHRPVHLGSGDPGHAGP